MRPITVARQLRMTKKRVGKTGLTLEIFPTTCRTMGQRTIFYRFAFDSETACSYGAAHQFKSAKLKRRVSTVAKPELGTKRLCPSCGAKYYDLNREPVTCPKCGAVFEAVMTSRAAKAAKVEEKPEEEEEEDAAAPEIVTLEEADAEAEGSDDEDVPDIDDTDVDLEEDDDDSSDDVFIDDEDEDDEAVPGIRVEIDEDTDR